MDLRSPMTAVIPGVSGEVLTVLARTSQELTGNVITSLADGKVSQTGVNKALKRLVSSGLVLSRPAGNAILYLLNPDHVATPAIIELSDLGNALLSRMKGCVAGWQHQPVAVAMFGSAARQQGTLDSDIDLLVIRPASIDQEDGHWADQLAELTEAVLRWSGNRCEILEFDADDFSERVRTGDTLIANLRTDAVGLAGTPLRELLRADR